VRRTSPVIIIAMPALLGPLNVAAQQAAAPDLLEAGATLGVGYGTQVGHLYDLGIFDASFSSSLIDFGAVAHITNDGKYVPTEGWMVQIGNQYFMLDRGYTRIHFGAIQFEAGYLQPQSSIETPYQVFLNPLAPGTLGMALKYDSSFFQYESRWISVNLRSSNTYGWGDAGKSAETWLDKGVNYRLMALKLGALRVGYEESAVYLRGFDPNYFFSPLPAILTNSILTQGHNPWTQSGGGGANDNSLMGLFADYKNGPIYGEAQLLMDDINLNFLFPPGSSLLSTNLNKLAWSIGGSYALPFGTIGFWHGGATAHTYAATYPTSYDPGITTPMDVNTIPYQYMYYPTVIFNGNIIDPRDSNIGFQWGENALAFRVTFDAEPLIDTPFAFMLASSLEYVINGSKSPDNPWHEYTSLDQIPQRMQLFDVFGPEVLEQYLLLHVKATKQMGSFTARLGLDIGGDFNILGVAYGDANMVARNEPPLLKPQPGVNAFVFKIEIGVKYTFTIATP
jgi:hypothetical protein